MLLGNSDSNFWISKWIANDKKRSLMHRNPFAQFFFSLIWPTQNAKSKWRFILCMNSTNNWNSIFHDASPDDHPIESTRVRLSESIGSWPWDKTETTTRNMAKRTQICLLLAANSAYFLGQFSINIFLSCSHRHTRLKKKEGERKIQMKLSTF